MAGLDPREGFACIARGPDREIDLAEAALLIAAEEYPGLAVDEYLARLDALAAGLAPRLRGAVGARERVARLNQYLFAERGFRGNRERYDDPRNSFLNEVLDRGVGIPISLSLVYTEVAARVGEPIRGVGFPGHFLVKHEAPPGIIVDPFHGRVLEEADSQQLLESVLGAGARLQPEHLRAATPREILVRMLNNLKQLYLRDREWERALACSERILLLLPDAPAELRDRSLLYGRVRRGPLH